MFDELAPTEDDDRPPWLTLGLPNPAGTPDLGPLLLGEVVGRLGIGDGALERAERAVRWRTGRLATLLSVSSPGWALEAPVVRLAAVTRVVGRVRSPREVVDEVLAEANARAGIGAFVWDPRARQVVLAATAWCNETQGWTVPSFAGRAATVAYQADVTADVLAEQLDGVVAKAGDDGAEADTVAATLFEQVAAAGVDAPPFDSADFAHLEVSGDVPWDRVFAHETALSGEFDLRPPHADDEPAVTASVLLGSGHPHGTLGAGLQVAVVLPLVEDRRAALALCTRLNRDELTQPTGFGLDGAWHVSGGDVAEVCFRGFLPAALAQPDRRRHLGHVAWTCWMRAWWAADTVLEEGSPIATLYRDDGGAEVEGGAA